MTGYNTEMIVSRLDSLHELNEKQDLKIDRIQNDISDVRVKVGKLEVKSGVWGTAGGALIAMASILWEKARL